MNVCIIKVSRKAKDNVGIDDVVDCRFFLCRAQPRQVQDNIDRHGV